MKYCKLFKNGNQAKFKDVSRHATVEDMMNHIIRYEKSYHKYDWLVVGENKKAACQECGHLLPTSEHKKEKVNVTITGKQLKEKSLSDKAAYQVYTWWDEYGILEIVDINTLIKKLSYRLNHPGYAKGVELFDVNEHRELSFDIAGLDIN